MGDERDLVNSLFHELFSNSTRATSTEEVFDQPLKECS